MTALSDIVRDCPKVEAHRPWPRALVDADAWCAAAAQLRGGALTLCGLWGEASAVHMALLDETA